MPSHPTVLEMCSTTKEFPGVHDARALAGRPSGTAESLAAGAEPETNSNGADGVNSIPAYLLEPGIVTSENAAESSATASRSPSPSCEQAPSRTRPAGCAIEPTASAS